MLKRKIISALKKLLSKIRSLIYRYKYLLLEENVYIGKNVTLGRNSILRTVDGGKIQIGDNVSIEGSCYIYAQRGEVTIGKNVFIGYGTQIVALKSIEIGRDCLISAYCIIRDATHGTKKSKLINIQPHTVGAIIIGNDAWLGSHCVVTSKASIENGAVIGANSVVTKKIDSYSIVGGVPARYINKRT